MYHSINVDSNHSTAIHVHLAPRERLDLEYSAFTSDGRQFATLKFGEVRLFFSDCAYAHQISDAIAAVNRDMDAAERRAALALVPEDATA